MYTRHISRGFLNPNEKKENKKLKIICYVDDAILLAETGDLQKLLHIFNVTARKLNLVISHKKSICMITATESIRYKLGLEGKIINRR